jgi:hypothetical protein
VLTIYLLATISALLLITAIRMIVTDDQARQDAEKSMDRALANKYKSNLSRLELSALAAARWD